MLEINKELIDKKIKVVSGYVDKLDGPKNKPFVVVPFLMNFSVKEIKNFESDVLKYFNKDEKVALDILCRYMEKIDNAIEKNFGFTYSSNSLDVEEYELSEKGGFINKFLKHLNENIELYLKKKFNKVFENYIEMDVGLRCPF